MKIVKNTRLLFTSFIPEAFVKYSKRFWQVFWLTSLSDAFPFRRNTDSGWSFRKIIRGLQLRVQLRILTGFPFDPVRQLPDRGTKSATNVGINLIGMGIFSDYLKSLR